MHIPTGINSSSLAWPCRVGGASKLVTQKKQIKEGGSSDYYILYLSSLSQLQLLSRSQNTGESVLRSELTGDITIKTVHTTGTELRGVIWEDWRLAFFDEVWGPQLWSFMLWTVNIDIPFQYSRTELDCTHTHIQFIIKTTAPRLGIQKLVSYNRREREKQLVKEECCHSTQGNACLPRVEPSSQRQVFQDQRSPNMGGSHTLIYTILLNNFSVWASLLTCNVSNRKTHA